MLSSSTTSSPPRHDHLSTNSSPSKGQFENFDPNTASPALKYRTFSENINAIVPYAERHLNPQYTRPLIPTDDNIFSIAEDQPNPQIVAGSAALGTGTIAEVSRRALRSPLEAPPVYRGPGSSSSSDISISQYTGFALVGACVLLAAGVAYKSATSYPPFAEDLRTRIRNAFNAIVDDTITPHALLDMVNEIIGAKEASWFGRFFASRNPNPMGYLLLTKGIALDSIGINLDSTHPESLQRHQEAQTYYQMALTYNIGDNLRARILLAYARSLRMTNSPEGQVTVLLDQILENSPFHSIAEIERRELRSQRGEIMDRYQYPFEFLCPITQDIMVNPSYHTHNGHRYYFEGNAIQAWLVTHDNCPLSRRSPLTGDDLFPDDERREMIVRWSQTKLKPNIVGTSM